MAALAAWLRLMTIVSGLMPLKGPDQMVLGLSLRGTGNWSQLGGCTMCKISSSGVAKGGASLVLQACHSVGLTPGWGRPHDEKCSTTRVRGVSVCLPHCGWGGGQVFPSYRHTPAWLPPSDLRGLTLGPHASLCSVTSCYGI